MAELYGMVGPNQLGYECFGEITDSYNTLITHPNKLAEGDSEAALALRSHATNVLTAEIANSVTGEIASLVLADAMQYAIGRSADSVIELYAVWGVIRNLRETYPDALRPAALICAALARAVELDEQPIIFDLSDIADPYADTHALESEFEEQADVLSEISGLIVEEMAAIYRPLVAASLETSRALAALALSTRKSLKAAKYTVHDQQLIRMNSNTYTKLFIAVRAGFFVTDIGRDAAMVMHDRMRLAEHANDLVTLQADLKMELFFTDEGKYAAGAQHDKIWLDNHATSMTDIRNALDEDTLITDMGVYTAQRLLGQL